jgi:hypothetical protein
METQQKLRLIFVNEQDETSTGIYVDWVPKEYRESEIIDFINQKFKISCHRLAVDQGNNKLTHRYENAPAWITYVFSNDTPQIHVNQSKEIKHFSLPIFTKIPVNLGDFRQEILNQVKNYYTVSDESEINLLSACYSDTFGKLVPSSDNENSYHL